MAKHIHKYKRQKIGRAKNYIIYRCMKPNCPHYISEDFIEGRESVCWSCDQTFIIKKKLLRIKPICEACKKAGKAQPIEGFDFESGFDLDQYLIDKGEN